MPINIIVVRGRVLIDVQLFVLGALRYIATRYTFDALDKLMCVK